MVAIACNLRTLRHESRDCQCLSRRCLGSENKSRQPPGLGTGCAIATSPLNADKIKVRDLPGLACTNIRSKLRGARARTLMLRVLTTPAKAPSCYGGRGE